MRGLRPHAATLARVARLNSFRLFKDKRHAWARKQAFVAMWVVPVDGNLLVSEGVDRQAHGNYSKGFLQRFRFTVHYPSTVLV